MLRSILLLTACALASCARETAPDAGAPDSSSPDAEGGATAGSNFASQDEVPDAALGDYFVTLECAIDGEALSPMTFEMWPEHAPGTVRNFLRLCDEGFYDGKTFHRVVRDFMVQGGCPLGNGTGDSPHGSIRAEFSDDPERAHRYGVLSMARSPLPDSASCQFFIICDDGPSAWGLDGQYASFGCMTSGVEALEALANVKTTLGSDGAMSRPTSKLTIVKATVAEGDPPSGRTIERPFVAPDLGGEPERVVVQHVLVGFESSGTPVTGRTAAEAEKIARQVAAGAEAGGDFTALVKEHSDDPPLAGATLPGSYRLLNSGVRDSAADKALFEFNRSGQATQQEYSQKVQSGELTLEAGQQALSKRLEELTSTFLESAWLSRDMLSSQIGSVADVGFSMEVGGVQVLPFDAITSPRGWVVVKRIE